MSVFRDDNDRSGWSNDSFRTTRLLYTAQHSYCPSCHYPDLWLRTADHDVEQENHQHLLENKNSCVERDYKVKLTVSEDTFDSGALDGKYIALTSININYTMDLSPVSTDRVA